MHPSSDRGQMVVHERNWAQLSMASEFLHTPWEASHIRGSKFPRRLRGPPGHDELATNHNIGPGKIPTS